LTLVADYEQLRGAALGTEAAPAPGLGLVLRGGVAAWMRAAGPVSVSWVCPSPSAASSVTVMPEMVRLVSQMVLAAARQVQP